MRTIRRMSLVLFGALAIALAAGCGGSTDSPTLTAADQTPLVTVTPQDQTPLVTVTPSSEQTRATPNPDRPFNPGLLQAEFCVVDIVAPDTLNVRAGPSTDNEIVATLDEGECRIFLTGGDVGGWREIVVDPGNAEIRGWVSGRFITLQRAQIDPNAPTVVITVVVKYPFEGPELEPAIDSFQLSETTGPVFGFLDTNGQITVPADFDPNEAYVLAEFVDDPYCAWTGRLLAEGPDRYIAELAGLCT